MPIYDWWQNLQSTYSEEVTRLMVYKLLVQRDFTVQRDFDSYNETLRFTLTGEL